MTTRPRGKNFAAFHVVRTSEGWEVRRDGTARAISVHASKAEAAKAATGAARAALSIRRNSAIPSETRTVNAPTVVGAFEAKTNLGQLLDRVADGDTIIITKRGTPVAKLVPFDQGINREHVRDVVDAFMARKSGARLAPGIGIEDLVNEGRR